MSRTYIAAIIGILSQVLPMLGIEVGSAELTTTLSTIITVLAGLWVMVRRFKAGDITPLGVRK